MEIVKNASAGTMESSDVYVEIEPAQMLTVGLESVVKAQFGDAILNVVNEVLSQHQVDKAAVRIVDRGALECVIRARVETAILREGGGLMRRSMLFLPGNNPNLLINGNCLGADAVIFDLEDAVSPTEKDAARILVRNTMRYMDFRGCEQIVRINSIDTPYWQMDIDAILPYKPSLILLPKTGSEQDVLAVDAYISSVEEALGLEQGSVGLMPLIETALGVENAFRIASATKRVKALFLGAEDLTADLQCKRTKESREIEYARTRLVVAARAAGVEVYDTPFTDVNDDEGIVKDANVAKALGFNGKASISPRHVEVINSVFSPTQQEVDYAYEVMDAIALAKQQGKGAIALHGKMIDAPIVARAERTIAMAAQLGLERSV